MPIKAVLDAEGWGGLDESLQDLYTKDRGGRYVLDAEGVDDLPSVQGLVTTLNKYKEVAPSAHGLQAKLAALDELEGFGELDLTADEVSEKLQRLDELEATGDGDLDEKIAALRETYEGQKAALSKKLQKDLDAKDTEIAQRDAFIEKLLVDNQLDAALDEAGIIPETKRGVKALIKEDHKPKVVRNGDGYEAVVSTELGDVSINDFVGSWAKSDAADPYMPASGNNGTGSGSGRGPRGSRGGANPFAKDTRNITEQMRLMKENPDQARMLAAEAGVRLPKVDAA